MLYHPYIPTCLTATRLDWLCSNWGKVLKYVVANKELGIDELLKNRRTKYKVSTKVQKALKDNIA